MRNKMSWYINHRLFEEPAPTDADKPDYESQIKERDDRYNKLKTEFEAISTKANLTAAERKQLEERVALITNEKQSETTRLERELSKTQRAAKEKEEAANKEGEKWRNKYTESTIIGRITQAAANAGAYSSDQLVKIMRPDSKLVPVIGEDNQPTDEFEVKVKYTEVDPKDPKKIVTLDLSPEEAVVRMKDREDYKNLFKASQNGGVGGNNNKGGSPTEVDLAKLISEGKFDEYKELTNKKNSKKG